MAARPRRGRGERPIENGSTPSPQHTPAPMPNAHQTNNIKHSPINIPRINPSSPSHRRDHDALRPRTHPARWWNPTLGRHAKWMIGGRVGHHGDRPRQSPTRIPPPSFPFPVLPQPSTARVSGDRNIQAKNGEPRIFLTLFFCQEP